VSEPREPSEWATIRAIEILQSDDADCIPLGRNIGRLRVTIARALDAARAEAEEALLKRLDDERWEEREPGVTAEWVEEHTAAATDGGSLVAVWREWLSAYGPGIFTRLSMARDIDGLLARARAEGRREGVEEAAKVVESLDIRVQDYPIPEIPQSIATAIRALKVTP